MVNQPQVNRLNDRKPAITHSHGGIRFRIEGIGEGESIPGIVSDPLSRVKVHRLQSKPGGSIRRPQRLRSAVSINFAAGPIKLDEPRLLRLAILSSQSFLPHFPQSGLIFPPMKLTRNFCRRALALSLVLVPSAHAANATWNGSSSGLWGTTGNWSASPVPGTGNTATFNAASSNTAISLNGVVINTILFNTASAAAYTLGTGAVGSQTLTLNDSGAITVNSSVANSQLFNANVVLGTGSTSANYSFSNNSATNGQLLTIAGNVSSGQSNTNNQAKVLTLDGTANGLISGIISGDGSGNGGNKTATVGVTKTGTGVWTLTGANTYSDPTTVTTGTLFANNSSGSATGFGDVSVGVNGILGGTGTIAPTSASAIAINVTGVLAPGGSVGTGNLTFDLTNTTGKVAMASGSGFQYQLGAAGLNIGAFGTSDVLTLAGAATGDFGFSGNTINFLGTGGVGFYKLFDTSLNSATTWTGLTVSGTGLITSGLTVSNLGSGLTGSLIMGGNPLGGTAGDIYLQIIPEPSAALLAGVGSLLLLRRRRES